MSKVLSRCGLKVGLETTPGVYQAPSQVLKLNSVITPNVEFDSVEIPNFSFYAGAKDVITIADWGQGSFDVETCFYDNLDFYSTLFKICNLKQTEDNQGNPVFTPDTHSQNTASVDLILPDRKFKLQGAKSNFKLSGQVGDKINITFGLKAAYNDREMGKNDITDIKSGEALVIRRLGGMTLNGVAVNLSEFSFDMGCNIGYEKFTNVGEFHISDYEPKLTLKMRLEKDGADGFDEFKAGTTMSFVAIFRNAEGKDCFKLEIPRAKLSEQPKFSDSDGIFVIERTFLAIADKGDDNFKLTYIKANNRNKQQAEGREQSRQEPSSS